MNNMKHSQYKQQRWRRQWQNGFTLVETLVAISILLVAIMGPMTIAARGLQSAFHAREQITAFSLAQEGVELIRQKRDENALQSTPTDWLAGILGFCGSNNGCGLDAKKSDTFINCNPSGNPCQLRDEGGISGHRGFYNHTAGTLTPFTRQIWVKEIPGGNDREAEVTVEVSWHSGLFAGTKMVTIQSRIFNQYDDI